MRQAFGKVILDFLKAEIPQSAHNPITAFPTITFIGNYRDRQQRKGASIFPALVSRNRNQKNAQNGNHGSPVKTVPHRAVGTAAYRAFLPIRRKAPTPGLDPFQIFWKRYRYAILYLQIKGVKGAWFFGQEKWAGAFLLLFKYSGKNLTEIFAPAEHPKAK